MSFAFTIIEYIAKHLLCYKQQMLGAYNFSHLGLVALGSAFKVAGVKQYIVFNWIMFTSTGYKLSSIQHCLEVHVYRILLPAFLLGQNKKVKKN